MSTSASLKGPYICIVTITNRLNQRRKMEQIKKKYNLPLVDAKEFNLDTSRYELQKGNSEEAPNCPYGNNFLWIGYDKLEMKYVRFTKSVFKKMINKMD